MKDIRDLMNKLPMNGMLKDDDLDKVAGGFGWEINDSMTEIRITLNDNEQAKTYLGMFINVFAVTPESIPKAQAAAEEMDQKGIKACTIYFTRENNVLDITEITLPECWL